MPQVSIALVEALKCLTFLGKEAKIRFFLIRKSAQISIKHSNYQLNLSR